MRPIIASAQGLTVTRLEPKMPITPITRLMPPAIVRISAKILIIVEVFLISNYCDRKMLKKSYKYAIPPS